MTSYNRTIKNIRHFGPRPKNDQDNHCRELLSELARDFGYFYEACPEKLYLLHLAEGKKMEVFNEERVKNYENCPFIFWFFENDNYFTYENFNMDFGPFNLGVTHLFCSRLKLWLDTQALRDPDKYIVIVTEDTESKRNLNLKLLVAIGAMVLLNMSDQEIIDRLKLHMFHKDKPGTIKGELKFKEKTKFSDVSGNHTKFSLTLEDCIRAFYAAMKLKWYNFYQFDHPEYLFYETPMSGDLNWIVPNKIIAFAGPNDANVHNIFYQKHPPQFYYHYFKDHNVSTVIRLNDPEYDSSGFTDFGFEHFDLIFPDGCSPSSTIAAKFIKIVDEAKGAVAVHCYAGIGRTGTLIAAYIMARYKFSPQMAVAWTRICRPGSVIAEQQDWLFIKFNPYSIDSTQTPSKCRKTKAQPPSTSENISSIKNEDVDKKESSQQIASTTYEVAEKTYGQAKALLLAKKNREKPEVNKPCTRNTTNILRKAAIADAELDATTRASKRLDFILDLGKTLPFGISLDHVNDMQRGEFYYIKDHKYEWRVKFPRHSYVDVRYCGLKELKKYCSDTPWRNIENIPEFRYEPDGETIVETKNGSKVLPKLRPVVFYCPTDVLMID